MRRLEVTSKAGEVGEVIDALHDSLLETAAVLRREAHAPTVAEGQLR